MPEYKIPKKIKSKPKGMVGWYNVRQLITTGFKSIISSLFGSYADRRELQAAISENEIFDYSQKEELWLDYVADLGDGFNSTFTVASSLSENHLTVDNLDTKKGDILIMGGDQVYPVAHKKHYKDRFLFPYEVANPQNITEKHADLFAIPGNHDWYDGLSNFLKIFINDRYIGNWLARQHRSYFALRLHKNLWLWGIDIQLDTDIDKPQQDYFYSVIAHMKKGDKLILCTSKPSWLFHSEEEKESYRTLRYFEKTFIVRNGLDLVLTIAGDSHHYARYTSEQKNSAQIHKITSGGGGAFLHPTHNLPSSATIREGKFELKKCYPSKSHSFRLLFMNLLFPALNPEFAGFMGLLYLFMAWLLQSVTLHKPVFNTLSKIEPSWNHLPYALNQLAHVIMYSPGLLIIILGIFFGSIAFADKNSGRVGLAYTMGIFQGLLHVVAGLALIWLLSYFAFQEKGYNLETIFVFSGVMFLCGGLIGALILGLYLTFSNLLGLHDNEAFSSLKWEGYKNFLRFKISKDKITIYPIGFHRIVKWKVKDGFIKGPKPQPTLIEEPIVINLK